MLFLTSCSPDEALEQIYPSRDIYESGTELTLMGDEDGEVNILGPRIMTFQFLGEQDAPVRMIIRFRISGEDIHITGYDPKGIYAPFSFFGTPEELFDISPDDPVEAQIRLETLSSRSTYELENMTFCQVGD